MIKKAKIQELELPHKEPIRFAKYIINKIANKAMVKIEFIEIPSLPMIIEASVQSSSALNDNGINKGYIVSLKDIKLLQEPTQKEFNVEVESQHSLNNMESIIFNVFENKIKIATGSFVVAII